MPNLRCCALCPSKNRACLHRAGHCGAACHPPQQALGDNRRPNNCGGGMFWALWTKTSDAKQHFWAISFSLAALQMVPFLDPMPSHFRVRVTCRTVGFGGWGPGRGSSCPLLIPESRWPPIHLLALTRGAPLNGPAHALIATPPPPPVLLHMHTRTCMCGALY